jgi:ATP-dependent Clp protease ATP-binding subunit ClpA
MVSFLRLLPQNTPPIPAAQTRDPPEEVDLSQVVNLSEITPPRTAASAALDYRDIRRELEKSIIGQATAVETIAHQTALFLNKSNPKKPLSIVAYGPPGTGKSETAKALSKTLTKLTGRRYADVWTDLNQFTEPHSVYRLLGSPPGYVGYEDTPVFEVITRNPYTVAIFDELDKTHPDVLKTFMAVLDEGRCAARKDLPNGSREYDFKHCIFIFTSNYRLGGAPKKRIGFSVTEDVDEIRHTDAAVQVRYTAPPEETQTGVTGRIYRETEAARKSFVEAGVLREIASRFNCFVGFTDLSDEAKIRILAKQVIETGFEYNLRLTHISSPILQALTDASASENALTVRSFKAVIDGHLSGVFAEASARCGGQSVRLTGTIDAPEIRPA